MDSQQHSLDGQLICALDPDARLHRRLEWLDLRALALTAELLPNGVCSTFPLALREAVEDLATREAECCGSWLHTTIERVGDTVRLTVTSSSPEGQATIQQMSGLHVD